MHLNRRHWEFRGDCEPFGFDPAKRMSYIGETSSGDDVWMVWAPVDGLGARARLGDELELSGEVTRMDPPTARVMMAMLCWMLEHINFSNISLINDYPDVTSDATFCLSSDFLSVFNLIAHADVDRPRFLVNGATSILTSKHLCG